MLFRSEGDQDGARVILHEVRGDLEYSAEIVDESGEAVLVARRDTGEDVAVYLSPAAAEGFAASLLEWAGRA